MTTTPVILDFSRLKEPVSQCFDVIEASKLSAREALTLISLLVYETSIAVSASPDEGMVAVIEMFELVQYLNGNRPYAKGYEPYSDGGA